MDRGKIDYFWAHDFFGCTASDFLCTRDIACPHFYLAGYHGVFILKIFGKFIVSAPKEKVPVFVQVLNQGNDLFAPEILQSILNDSYDCCIGPSWIGCPASGTTCYTPESIKILSESDTERSIALDQLKASCDPTEWSHCGIEKNSEYIAVQCIEGKIVSAASYEKWGNQIAHIGVITHPGYRNRGYAQNVLTAITGYIDRKGFIPQYRTLCTNIPAVNTAIHCGYAHYASHISVRLK